MAKPLIFISLLLSISLWLLLVSCYSAFIFCLKGQGLVEANFRTHPIAFGVGMIIPWVLILCLPWAVLEGVITVYLLQTFLLGVIAYVGWCDDRFGERETKGIKGHFALWWKTGRRSTGFWKAVVGCFIALIIG